MHHTMKRLLFGASHSRRSQAEPESTVDSKVPPLLNLPQDLIYDVLDQLEDDLPELLNLRRVCKQLELLVNRFLRGKLTIHIGYSVDKSKQRMTAFQNSTNVAYKSCFSSLALYQLSMRPHYKNVTLRMTDKVVEALAMGFLSSVVPFVKEIGPQLKELRIEGTDDSDWNDAKIVQDRFCRVIALVLLYAGEKYLPDVRRFKMQVCMGRYLGYFMQCVDDPNIEELIYGKIKKKKGGTPLYFQGGDWSDFDLGTWERNLDWKPRQTLPTEKHWFHNAWLWNGWWDDAAPPRVKIPFFDRVEDLEMINDLQYEQGEDPTFYRFLDFAQCNANVRSFKYYAAYKDSGFVEDCPAVNLPKLERLHMMHAPADGPALINRVFANWSGHLTRLYMEHCTIHAGAAPVKAPSGSDPGAVGVFLDALLPTLPNLRSLRIDCLAYTRFHELSYDMVGSMRSPNHSWGLGHTISSLIEGPDRRRFPRPVISPFKGDMLAFKKLRDGYAFRRKDMGLQEDEWLRFLLREGNQSEVLRVVEFEEMGKSLNEDEMPARMW